MKIRAAVYRLNFLRHCRLVFAVIVAPGVIASSSLASAQTDGITDTAIKVGVIVPLTGESAFYGKSLAQGTQAAFNKVNSTGGVHGRKLEMVTFDGGFDGQKALTGATKLIQEDKIAMFMNVFGTPAVKAIIPILEKNNMTLVGPMSSANFSDPFIKSIFVCRSNMYFAAQSLVDFLFKEKKLADWVVVYQDDSMGTSGVAATEKALAAQNLKAKARIIIPKGTTDFAAMIKTIREAKPQAIMIMALMPLSGQIVKELKKAGITAVLAGGTPLASAEFLAAKDYEGFDVYVGNYAPNLSGASHLIQSYKSEMKKLKLEPLDQYGADAYLNATVAIEGIKLAGKNLNRDTLKTGLESIKNFEVDGSMINFSPSDHQGLKKAFLGKIKDGVIVDL